MLAGRMRMAAAGAGGAEWWEVSGKTCVGAWLAKGAASQAESYLDLSGNGNNLSLGVAPTWNTATGWTFNGSTQYLDTGVTPAADTWTYIIRHSNSAVGSSALFGFLDSNKRTYIQPTLSTAVWFANDNTASAGGSAQTSGVLAVTGDYGYIDGVEDVAIGDWGTGTALSIYIAAIHRSGSITNYLSCNIQAFSIYSSTLSSGDVSTLTTNMQAL